MNWKAFTALALFLLSPLISNAAPITYKEIAMLVRNREREQFIFSEAQNRKLLEPLSKQEENILSGLGASAGLLNALRASAILAPPDMVAAYKARMQPATPAPQSPPTEEAPRAILLATPAPSPP